MQILEEVKHMQGQIDKNLKESLDGLRKVDKRGRPDKFTLRIFTKREYNRKINKGSHIID